MKKARAVLWAAVLFLSGIAVSAFAAEAQPQKIDKSQMEGDIVTIDYVRNYFRLRDDRGFERKVWAKQGMIGTFKVGDHLKVSMGADGKQAKMIEKLSGRPERK